MENTNQALITFPPIKPLEKHLDAARSYQGVPGIAVTKGGCIYVSWFSGWLDEGPGNFSLLYRSTDDGKSWEGPLWVVDPLTPGTRSFDPQLWIDPDGCLWWFWHQDYCPDYQTVNIVDPKRGVWACRCDNPDDKELAWSTPTRLCDGTLSGKPKVLSDGSWCFVTYHALRRRGQQYDALFQQRTGINFYRSNDKLASAEHVSTVCPTFRNYCDECDFVETAPGCLWILFRAAYGPGETFSYDNGRTWFPCAPSVLRGPDSRTAIEKLPDGRIVVVHNALPPVGRFGQDTPRKDLTAVFTRDNGRTWTKSVLLDERLHTSYPSIATAPDGAIWVAYDCMRYDGGEIRAAKIEGDEMTANVLVNSTRPVYPPREMMPSIILSPENRTDAPYSMLKLPDGAIPKAQTDFRILYRQDKLIMEFVCHEPDDGQPFIDNEIRLSDCIDVFIAPDAANPWNFYQLLCDFSGRTAANHRDPDKGLSPIPLFFSATSRRQGDGWSLVFEVPWSELSCKGPKNVCGNIFRRRYGKKTASEEGFHCFFPCSYPFRVASFVNWTIDGQQ